MRQLYETTADIDNERKVIEYLSSRWMAKAVKLSTKYCLDYAMFRDGKAVSFVEVKCRKRPLVDFNYYELSLYKYREMRQLSIDTNLPSLLVVRFSCGAVAYRKILHDECLPIVYSGRRDRQDWQDFEPMVQMQISDFTHAGKMLVS